MKNRLIQILILCSLFFNIAHATLLALEEDCHHDSVSEYVMDTHAEDDCGDLCDLHHYFHFMAVVSCDYHSFEHCYTEESFTLMLAEYTPPLIATDIKPPIC